MSKEEFSPGSIGAKHLNDALNAREEMQPGPKRTQYEQAAAALAQLLDTLPKPDQNPYEPGAAYKIIGEGTSLLEAIKLQAILEAYETKNGALTPKTERIVESMARIRDERDG